MGGKKQKNGKGNVGEGREGKPLSLKEGNFKVGGGRDKRMERAK